MMDHYLAFRLCSFWMGCLVFWSLFMASCQEKEPQLLVAVASNMQFAMEEVLEAFERKHGEKTELIVSSSGKLTAQILEGAPYDLFVSADMKFPRKIEAASLAHEPSKLLGCGQLICWSASQSDSFGMDSLLADKVEHIALANPKTAPFGRAAEEVLQHQDLLEKLNAKLVYGESIAQVNQFVLSQAAQYGFTSKSVLFSPHLKTKGSWFELPSAWYSPIEQVALLLKKDGKVKHKAQELYTFLFSKEAGEIFESHGYVLPEN